MLDGGSATEVHAERPSRWWLTLDAIAVLVFVVAGRRFHKESGTLDDVLRTAAPFLWGLLAGWALARAWRAPLSWVTAAIVVGLTYGGGLLLSSTDSDPLFLIRDAIFSDNSAIQTGGGLDLSVANMTIADSVIATMARTPRWRTRCRRCPVRPSGASW